MPKHFQLVGLNPLSDRGRRAPRRVSGRFSCSEAVELECKMPSAPRPLQHHITTLPLFSCLYSYTARSSHRDHNPVPQEQDYDFRSCMWNEPCSYKRLCLALH